MKMLTAPEVAQLLRVKPARVYELARLGMIPCLRIGRQVRFAEESLREWIACGGSTEKRQPTLRE
jgi:excisionase family DNA binding protein